MGAVDRRRDGDDVEVGGAQILDAVRVEDVGGREVRGGDLAGAVAAGAQLLEARGSTSKPTTRAVRPRRRLPQPDVAETDDGDAAGVSRPIHGLSSSTRLEGIPSGPR